LNPETSLVTFKNWTLRIRQPQADGKRILLMLHGLKGDENSMWVFARNFPADCWIVAPRAPYAVSDEGYSWRASGLGGRAAGLLEPKTSQGRVTPPDWPTVDILRPSVDALVALLDAWAQANGLDASQVDVTGFSQGAAMTFMLGLLHPARVRKMGILAGFAPEGTEQVLAPGHFNGKKVFVAHGTKDEMVPVEQARRSIRLLEGAGAQVVYCESEVGHKLSADCLKALEGYLVD